MLWDALISNVKHKATHGLVVALAISQDSWQWVQYCFLEDNLCWLDTPDICQLCQLNIGCNSTASKHAEIVNCASWILIATALWLSTRRFANCASWTLVATALRVSTRRLLMTDWLLSRSEWISPDKEEWYIGHTKAPVSNRKHMHVSISDRGGYFCMY